MSVQSFLDEAFERGEKIRSKFLEDLLASRVVNQLLKNEKFLNTVVALLNAKTGLEKKIHQRLQSLFKRLHIPTRDDIRSMESKIHRLESEVEAIQRKAMTQSLRKKAAKKVTHHKKR